MGKVNHVAIIADGGRRWAKRENVTLRTSYRKMMDLLALDTEALFRTGVNVVTLYLLSKENLRRKRHELAAALVEEKRFVEEIVPKLCSRLTVSPNIAGTVDLLPRPWDQIRLPPNRIGLASKKKLNLCLAYSPALELSSAVRKLSGRTDPDAIMKSLWINQPVDLLIRTGGAHTLSNFIPLQCGYARLVFLDDLFNDTSAETVLDIVQQHTMQDFKFGW